MGPGERVAVWTSDRFAFLVAHLGVLFRGGVSLPLNSRFTREEMRHFLTDSGAAVVVGDPDNLPLLDELRPASARPAECRHCGRSHSISTLSTARHAPTASDDPCLILYSSGTTGRPKGVVHTSANLGASLRVLRDCSRITPDDAVLHVLPLFHIHGLSFAAQMTLLAGGRLLLEDGFHPDRTLAAAERRQWSWPCRRSTTGYWITPDSAPRRQTIRRAAVHLRVGPDPARSATGVGRDPR